MKIGVISDTHDHLPGIDWAKQVLQSEGVEAICHCGDWVAPFTIEYFVSVFGDFPVPVYSVFGNNEGDIKRIVERTAALAHPIEFAAKTVLELELDQRRIVIYHGQDSALLEALIASQSYQAVFTGHTHLYRNEVINSTLVLNPGALIPARASHQTGELSLAIYDTATNTAIQHRTNSS